MNIQVKKIETAKETLVINGKQFPMHRLSGESATEIVKQMSELAMDFQAPTLSVSKGRISRS